VAVVEEMGASGAYWIASQAPRVLASSHTTAVGSIGAYLLVYDTSAAAAQIGVRVHVVRSGEFKGAGVPGTVVTDPQLREWQRMVDQTAAAFVQAVAEGRRQPVSRVKSWADGRVHSAADAMQLGLIDGMGTAADAVAMITSGKASIIGKGGSAASGAPNHLAAAAGTFDQAVREAMATGMDRRKACLHVAATRPALHLAYLAATNRQA
jgi:ClpP class serine protease